MHVVLRFCFALLLLAGAVAHAADIADADRGQIKSVIEQQLAAFARDDAAAAFGFASPGIQRQFGSADTFMAMVRSDYRAVYRPRSVSFGELERVADNLVQIVDLIGPAGESVRALYIMERDGEGAWRITGVSLVPGTQKET
ncbi:MAG TPA: DUF4864 domain-containing protein [Stellaceae bacterium]|nr:DUF4864 domain-containing protein [Stellaceae bacterium]